MTDSQQSPLPSRQTRIAVDIPVTIDSVLVSGDAHLRDLTEYGALIEGLSMPKGTQFQIEYEGQTIFGFAVWSESDRFGARFPFPLHDGPLYRRLEMARNTHGMSGAAIFVSGKRPVGGFGRRGIS